MVEGTVALRFYGKSREGQFSRNLFGSPSIPRAGCLGSEPNCGHSRAFKGRLSELLSASFATSKQYAFDALASPPVEGCFRPIIAKRVCISDYAIRVAAAAGKFAPGLNAGVLGSINPK